MQPVFLYGTVQPPSSDLSFGCTAESPTFLIFAPSSEGSVRFRAAAEARAQEADTYEPF